LYIIQSRSAVGFFEGSAEENKKPSVPKSGRRALEKELLSETLLAL
jgi:hypothetical protein